MFTGVVEAWVPVERIEPAGEGARLWLPAPSAAWTTAAGESVAVNGACLTVAAHRLAGSECAPGLSGAAMGFDLSAETLARTSFGTLAEGDPVNLERAMRLSDRLSGHLVSGHVDGGATLVAIADPGDGGRRLSFEVDEGLERYLIEKGSVTLDGVSLTVVEPRGRRFDVAVIPLTLEVTNLGAAREGKRLNVEADLVGKWIEKLVGGPRGS